MYIRLSAPLARRISIPLAMVIGWPAFLSGLAAQSSLPAEAADPAQHLPGLVISATRTPQDPQITPSSVSLLSLDFLQSSQITDLRTALNGVPGAAVVNTGATGGQSAVFLRGANSDQTLFIVDGVRMNSRSDSYANFLGGADLAGLDRIEVLRGPQSTLYGSSAMGGVVLLETAHGCGTPSGILAANIGSFDTAEGSAAVEGGNANLGYSASVSRLQTANDRPDNDYNQWSYSARVESPITPALLIGATVRGLEGDYQEPGSRFYPTHADVNTHNHLVTAYGRWNDGQDVTSRLTLALHRQDYTYADDFTTSRLHNLRDIIDWQTSWTVSPQAEIIAGANTEWSRYVVNGEPSNDNSRAVFLSTDLRPIQSLAFTGGVRYDNFTSVGGATTGRGGVSWFPVKDTRLRITYGTGFNAPGSDDRYGVAQWGQLPNPNIRPERSRGWDAGIDQSLAEGRVTVSATWFQNKFRDLFDYQVVDYTTFQGYTVNRAHATTEGVELASKVRLTSRVTASASYTYLDARDDDTGMRLIRRPRHVGDLDAQFQATTAWLLGGGLHFNADRTDSAGPMPGYTTVRLYTSYQVAAHLWLKLRIENLFNKAYEEVLGYPALPRGIFGGVEWRF